MFTRLKKNTQESCALAQISFCLPQQVWGLQGTTGLGENVRSLVYKAHEQHPATGNRALHRDPSQAVGIVMYFYFSQTSPFGVPQTHKVFLLPRISPSPWHSSQNTPPYTSPAQLLLNLLFLVEISLSLCWTCTQNLYINFWNLSYL